MKHCAKKLLGLAFALALCLAVGGTALAQTPEFADVPAALPEQEVLAYEQNVTTAAGTNIIDKLATEGYTVTIPTTVTVDSKDNTGELTVNAQLKAENEKLQQDLIKATLTSQELSTLKELQASLNYAKSQNISNYITCDIIAKDPGNWYNLFVINAGSSQGVLKNSTVLCGEGLVGLVYEVGDDWAKVVSIVDNKSAVGFEIMDVQNNYDGRVTGNADGSLKGYLYDPQAVVHTGQKIITSGLGLYPRGILIGEIREVITNKDNLLKEIVVEPEVDFLKLERVFVIPKTNAFVE